MPSPSHGSNGGGDQPGAHTRSCRGCSQAVEPALAEPWRGGGALLVAVIQSGTCCPPKASDLQASEEQQRGVRRAMQARLLA